MENRICQHDSAVDQRGLRVRLPSLITIFRYFMSLSCSQVGFFVPRSAISVWILATDSGWRARYQNVAVMALAVVSRPAMMMDRIWSTMYSSARPDLASSSRKTYFRSRISDFSLSALRV